ncbi:MAG TPA: DNA recombination protein RmuC [Nitrospiria bacterium]|nr:DNA recombination protein RmuC [Nitrospiria bacterium]
MEILAQGYLIVLTLSILLFTAIGGFVLYLIISGRRSSDQTILIQRQIDQVRSDLSGSMSQVLTHLNENLTRQSAQLDSQIGLMVQSLNGRLVSLEEQATLSAGQMGARMDHAAQIVGEVKQSLGALSQATERVFEVGRNISSLQDILKAPKLRGGLGELFLGELLSQIFPPSYFTLQYSFRSGETVDALIHLDQGGIPVDSKFPLENFRKLLDSPGEEEQKSIRKKFVLDVKKHIDAIAMKYIQPDEGTFDFALMYIPAENVFYETILKEGEEERSISAYALERKVIPVSPNSFYAYLQTILLGLKGLHIEKSSREILESLSRMRGDFDRFFEEFEILGKHLNNAKIKYDDAFRKLERFQGKLAVIENPGKKIEV